jgi:3-deoxy-7-phosphoheptulonate synthase
MVVLMSEGCKKGHIAQVISMLRAHGLRPRIVSSAPKVIIAVVDEIRGHTATELAQRVKSMPFVENVGDFESSWKLVSSQYHGQRSIVKAGGRILGSREVHVIAGPCAVESRDVMLRIAHLVKEHGAGFLRGGAFKPRTSPYSFRGLGKEGLIYLSEASRATGLPVVTEVLTPSDVEIVGQYAHMFQIGARNMQNFALLEAVGETDIPVLLKRGMMSTIQELLLSAEYVLSKGNEGVVLCERGIRTFETSTRNTLDLSAVPLLKRLSHLPVVVDPSHGVGLSELVPPMALAAVAAGADGIMVEVHLRPEEALSDGRQSLCPHEFGEMMKALERVAEAVGRQLGG